MGGQMMGWMYFAWYRLLEGMGYAFYFETPSAQHSDHLVNATWIKKKKKKKKNMKNHSGTKRFGSDRGNVDILSVRGLLFLWPDLSCQSQEETMLSWGHSFVIRDLLVKTAK